MNFKRISIVIPLLVVFLFVKSPVFPADKTPEQVYESYLFHIRKGNFRQMLSYLARPLRSQFKKLDVSQQKGATKLLKSAAPINYRIVDRDVSANRAVLVFRGKAINLKTGKYVTRGKCSFIKEGGKWKISREYWR